MNVRIGNDIRLNLTLKGPRNYDQSNIKQLRAYLINTSMKDYTEMWAPCCDCGRSHSCGRYGYHHPVSNYHVNFDRFNRVFHGCPGCDCGRSDGKVPFNPAFGEGPLRPNYGHPWHCDDHACHKCGRCHNWEHCHEEFDFPILPIHIDDNFKFLAPSRVLPKANQVQVYFPAREQFACGVYKLVVVVVVYEHGWGRHDLHTYTIDYGDVVTLVDDNTGVEGDITIDVDTDQLSNSGETAIVIKNNNYYLYPNKYISLGNTDNYNKPYTIDVTLENGTSLEYNPENWPYSKLNFQSTNLDLVQVGPDGTIMTKYSATTQSANVIVTTPDDPAVRGIFTVTVEGAVKDYIGFAPVRPLSINGIDRTDQNFENNSQEASDVISGGAASLNLESGEFQKVDTLLGTHHLNNTHDGWYLWIVSKTPIQSVSMGEFNVPLTSAEYVQKDRLYYYACPNPVRSTSDFGGIDVTVTLN